MVEERVKVRHSTDSIVKHMLGMAMMTFGVYITLKGLYGRSNPELELLM